MRELGGDPDLALEPVGADGGGQLLRENLDGDLAAMTDVFGSVDGRHPSAADLAIDAVALLERITKDLDVRNHPDSASRICCSLRRGRRYIHIEGDWPWRL